MITGTTAPLPVTARRPRLLLVDDEPRVLEALSRGLRRSFQTVTATSGTLGLVAIKQDGPFEVIVSDMRMPGMDGSQFLAHCRELVPSSVRILLTGQSDIDAAAAAVNNGQIFRFLQKPCPPDQLDVALAAAVEHYRLITAEQELLQSTLRGSVEVLTDVLALVSPVAFARSLRLKSTVAELSQRLGLQDRWAIEMAAMLSHLGAITVPPEVLERHHRGETLTLDERGMISGIDDLTRQLISHLPRLDPVREILAARHAAYDAEGDLHAIAHGEALPIGARLLLVATDFDALESQGETSTDCLSIMEGRKGRYDPRVLRALRAIKDSTVAAAEIREVRLIEVRVGMVFMRDVVAANGLVLIGRGQVASAGLVQRIRNFWVDLPLRGMPHVTMPES